MNEINQRNSINSELMEPILSDNARYIGETRYAIKNENGKITETVKDIFWRVAFSVAKGDTTFGKTDNEIEVQAKVFYQLMAEKNFS
jgi:ribonucleoside-diphosphate reductase alpha chain